jgi:hypothetical protein
MSLTRQSYSVTREARMVEIVKKNLRWMVEYPGEWMWWGYARFEASAHGIHLPSFEIRYVSPSVRDFEDHPLASWSTGLWVRYVGGEYAKDEKNATN